MAALDPAVTDTDQSDAHGVQIDGRKGDVIYRLFSFEQRASPLDAMRTALIEAVRWKASELTVETDQGGDLWRNLYDHACRALVLDGTLPQGTRLPYFRAEKAGAGFGPQAHRAQRMLAEYERGCFVHVLGIHAVLEKALRRFPLKKPFDLVDAAFWSWHRVMQPDLSKLATEPARYDYSGWRLAGDPHPAAPAPAVARPDVPGSQPRRERQVASGLVDFRQYEPPAPASTSPQHPSRTAARASRRRLPVCKRTSRPRRRKSGSWEESSRRVVGLDKRVGSTRRHTRAAARTGGKPSPAFRGSSPAQPGGPCR
jgi:hypothetical protein